MSTTNAVDIIWVLERLSTDLDYKAFCDYLVEQHMMDMHALMVSSKSGAWLSAEHYAKSKIYDSLWVLPSLILSKITETPKKKERWVYAQ